MLQGVARVAQRNKSFVFYRMNMRCYFASFCGKSQGYNGASRKGASRIPAHCSLQLVVGSSS